MSLLRMHNPETGGIATTTEEAFRTIWRLRGWEQVEPVAAAAADLLDVPVGSLDDLTVDQLHQVAAQSGVDVPAGAKKADLIAALRGEAPAAAVTKQTKKGER